MSDILIRSTKMPEKCFDSNGTCFAYDGVEYHCNLKPNEVEHFSARVCGIKPKWCPLKELPEHGDLIEKQTTLAALYSDYAYAAMDIIEKEVPVIIPASKENKS